MRPTSQTLSTVLTLAMLLATASAFAASAADDKTPAKDASILRICAAANETPYSMSDGTGFENRIADAVAKAMGRKADFVWSDRPAIYLVRDQLDPKNCDVVIGVDSDDQRVLTSKPYYRAPYVFVERTDSPLDITSWDSPGIKETNKIAFAPGTPAETMLTKLNLYGRNFNYMKSLTNFKSPRNQFVRIDPSRMVSEVEQGKADVAVAFAPEVARYVKDSGGKVKMVVVPDNNTRVDGERVPFHFNQSMGVRKGDEKLLEELDAAITKAEPQIHAILEEEGIPLLKPTPSNVTPKS